MPYRVRWIVPFRYCITSICWMNEIWLTFLPRKAIARGPLNIFGYIDSGISFGESLCNKFSLIKLHPTREALYLTDSILRVPTTCGVGPPTFVSRVYLYLQARSRLRTHRIATLVISFPRKLLRQRLEKLSPRPLRVLRLLPPRRRCLAGWRFWLFSIRSRELRFSPFLTLVHPLSTGADRGATTHRRCTARVDRAREVSRGPVKEKERQREIER